MYPQLDLSGAYQTLDAVSDVFSLETLDGMLLVTGRKVGVKAESYVSDYPPASGNALPLYYTRTRTNAKGETVSYQSKFKTLRQQRKVMSLVKQGKVPYRRTGTLGKSILSDAETGGSGVVIIRVGSNLVYAPYVLDKTMQSHYHLGTWTPIQDDIMAHLDELSSYAVKVLTAEINRRLSEAYRNF